jgi:hypothetical protein
MQQWQGDRWPSQDDQASRVSLRMPSKHFVKHRKGVLGN